MVWASLLQKPKSSSFKENTCQLSYIIFNSWSCCSFVKGAFPRLNLKGNHSISFAKSETFPVSGLSPNLGIPLGYPFPFGGSRFSSTSTALFSTCSCSWCGVASRNETVISSPSWLNSVQYGWGSTSTSNSSVASKGCLAQMFWQWYLSGSLGPSWPLVTHSS